MLVFVPLIIPCPDRIIRQFCQCSSVVLFQRGMMLFGIITALVSQGGFMANDLLFSSICQL